MNNSWRQHTRSNECKRRLLTTHRRNKVASSRRLNDDERNFGDLGYEVMVWHGDHAKTENGTKNELHVMKQQLNEKHEAAQTDKWVASGTGTTMGTTCTHGWNCAPTGYRSIPASGTEKTWWVVMLRKCKGFFSMHVIVHTHVIHWHTHRREDKERSPTRAGHVLWSVDAPGHQRRPA